MNVIRFSTCKPSACDLMTHNLDDTLCNYVRTPPHMYAVNKNDAVFTNAFSKSFSNYGCTYINGSRKGRKSG